jgi:2-polyprenyl-6-methoxyphenol hydroxylase-like FAD-dependent oxidoreductase
MDKVGSYLISVSTDGILTFDHGIEDRFDLIVGADGAWSKVRPVLTDIRPSYAGISGFELHILDPAQHHPEVSRMIGRGSYFAYSDCKALQAQRQGDGNVMLYACDTNTEEYPKKLLEEVGYDGEKVKRILLETLFQNWASELQAWL